MSCEVEFIKRLQIPSLILTRLFIKEDLLQLFTDIQGGKIIAPVNAVLVGNQHSDSLWFHSIFKLVFKMLWAFYV